MACERPQPPRRWYSCPLIQNTNRFYPLTELARPAPPATPATRPRPARGASHIWREGAGHHQVGDVVLEERPVRLPRSVAPALVEVSHLQLGVEQDLARPPGEGRLFQEAEEARADPLAAPLGEDRD